MQNKFLCMSVSPAYGIPVDEQIKLLSKTGFNGFFTGWKRGVDLALCRKVADECGMYMQSVHAPFGGCADMWYDDVDEAEKFISELCECVDACVSAGVDLMISHAFIGFDDDVTVPNDMGLYRYGRVIDYAAERGVKIAFENTEGEEFLAALLKEFGSRKNVGYCWDSGHEMCYNGSKDLLALYGDKLLGTHINDNLGVNDPNGVITWHDDLHLLPLDGIADWQYNMQRLKKCGFCGPLTFELNKQSKPERHDNDKYDAMPVEQYFAEAYARACRIAKFF